jgi:TonB-linked SusC/RagA family outer membrane protein
MKKSYFKVSLLGFVFTMCIVLQTMAQTTVTGKVTAQEDGGALPGVSVAVKGTSRGTVTDASGSYSLAVDGASSVLVFSFIGYQNQEVTVGNRSSVNVSLTADLQSLSEVVVTGYATQQKKDLTSAVTVVNSKDLLAVPATSVEQQLQGRAAGVTVISSNVPGQGAAVRIRGVGTFGNNDPLYVIDGVPTRDNLANINQNDIESIQILKDATSASIYGSRAGNGVVIITTKKGKSGEPKIAFDAYYGSQNPFRFPSVLNTQQYGEYLWASKRNAGVVDANTGNPSNGQYGSGANPVIPDYIVPSGAFEGDPRVNPANYSYQRTFPDGTNNPAFGSTVFQITRANKQGTEWLREIFNPAPIQNYQLGVSGGTDKGRYALSVGHLNQESMLIYNGFKRYTLRANTEFTVKKVVRIGENLQVAYARRQGTYNNQSEGNEIFMAYRMQPIIPVYDIQGNFAGTLGNNLGNASNPVANLFRRKDNGYQDLRVFGNVYAEADILKNFTARTSFGLDATVGRGRFSGQPDPENSEFGRFYTFDANFNYRYAWTWTNTLTYKVSLADIHRITAYVGTEAIKSFGEEQGGFRSRYFSADPSLRYLNQGDPSTQSNFGFAKDDYGLFSYFGQVNYSLMDKYLFQATLRRDASSRFLAATRYATFPAFSVGWRLSQEAFMQNVPWLSDLKLRAGWGKTGNQEIGNYNAYTTYFSDPGGNGYSFSNPNAYNFGFSRAFIGNPGAKWEATRSINVGFDAGFFNDKLTLNVDIWNRRTNDLLLAPQYGDIYKGSAGVANANVANVSNRGVDIGLNYSGKVGEFTFNISPNFSTFKNEVLSIDPANDQSALIGPSLRFPIPVTRSQKGYPISSFYAYQVEGILQSAEEVNAAAVYKGYTDVSVSYNGQKLAPGVGKFKYRDVNGDKIIDANDQTFIGNPNPKFTYGINVNIAYKGLELTLFGQGVYGNDLFNYVKYWTDFNTFQGARSTRILENSWIPGRTDATLPILDENDVISSQPSSYFIEKGSYFRMKNLQLAYNLPSGILSKIGLGNLRVYAQVQNAFTVTKYQGLDPEVAVRQNTNELGIDEGILPASRTFLFGLNLGF